MSDKILDSQMYHKFGAKENWDDEAYSYEESWEDCVNLLVKPLQQQNAKLQDEIDKLRIQYNREGDVK